MNKEELKEYHKKHYAKNKPRLKEYFVRYYQENKERISEYQRQYREKNKDIIKEKRKEYLKSHKKEKKEYDRKRRLRLGYNLSPQEYDDMLTKQHGKCAICGKSPSRGRALHIDHDHETGKIRELLCFSCNTLIGYSKENVIILKKAIDYLKKHK